MMPGKENLTKVIVGVMKNVDLANEQIFSFTDILQSFTSKTSRQERLEFTDVEWILRHPLLETLCST